MRVSVEPFAKLLGCMQPGVCLPAFPAGGASDASRAPVSASDRAMLEYAATLTHELWNVAEADVIALREVGFRDEAILDINQVERYRCTLHQKAVDDLQGNRFSHACPFARIMEERLADRLVQVGIRTMNGHQRAQAARFGVEVHEMKHWSGSLHLEFDSSVYITIDMDALDPAFAPGVSHHEPGGLSTREVINLIQAVKAPLVAADIVEFNPTRDPLGVTAMACAKLKKEIAAKMLSDG